MTLPPRRFRQKPDTGRSDIHRKFVRSHECILFGNPISQCDTEHPIQAAHYRTAANSGMGKKPHDRWLVPMCRKCHFLQHSIGQKAFEERYGISMRDKAMEFARVSPDKRIRDAVS